jgi:hypothetical protein
MYKRLVALACGCLLSSAASASLIFDAGILLGAQGFGNAPRDLTLQSQGNNTTESGCVGVGAGGSITFGAAACTPEGSVHDANGQANAGGDEPPPLADDQKYGIPSLGSLGITTASQIGVLFNATEPAGNSANVTDITLNFYSAAGVLLGAIDGQFNFLSTNPGNGVAGFTFVVSASELAYVNGLIALGGPGTLLSLNSTIIDVAGGPESFLIANLARAPEPGTLALLGAALIGGWVSRRRSLKT